MRSSFIVDNIYYQCHFSDIGSRVITSWVFLGFEDTPNQSSASCDIPNHFYAFAEWNSWWTRRNLDQNQKLYTLLIPSLRQAEMSMLTWEQLLQEIEDLSDDEA